MGSILNNIGRGLLIDGRLDEAKGFLARTLDIDRRTKPPDHDDLILPLNSLAMIDIAGGDYASAESKLDEALRIAEKQNHWMLDQVLTNLADVYARTGRAPQAEPLLARARALLEKQYPRDKMPDEAWRYALQDACAPRPARRRRSTRRRAILTKPCRSCASASANSDTTPRSEQRLARLPH